MKTFDAIWEQIHSEMEWGKYPPEEVIRFVARNYYKTDRSQTKILDAGCGAGAITWYLAREGFKVFSFDGSESAIMKAEQRLQSEGLSAELNISDASELPYEDRFFDAVIDGAMIYANKVDNIKKVLSECHRVLKKNGKIFSTGLFKIGMTGYGTGEKLENNTFRELTEGALAHRGIAHFFSEAEIVELWTSVGFRNIKIDAVDRTDHGGSIKISYYIAEAEK